MAALLADPALAPDHRDLDDERASIAASQTSTADTPASSIVHGQMPAPRHDTAASSQTSLDVEDGDHTMIDADAAPAPPQPNGTNGLNGNAMAPTLAKLQTHDISRPVKGNGTAPGSAHANVSASSNGDAPHGQKRTASGHVKTPSSASNVFASHVGRGHKRAASANPQVTELSAQLRARLSYAMLKVQNGWESRTLDEIEALASQHGSPMSLTSPWRGRQSPQHPYPSEAARLPPPAATTQASRALNGSLQTDIRLPPIQPYPNTHIPSSSAPALAPPVDFGARGNPRRTTVSGHPPPYLANVNGRHNSNVSASSASPAPSIHSAPLVPATPPLHDIHLTNLQTPSQRATASERDAIETLLFMSSPGNSQNFRNSASQPTPLQTSLQYSPPRSAMSMSPQRPRAYPHIAKQVSFVPAPSAAVLAADVVDRVPLSPRKRGPLDGARLENEESIDRVLDQMPVNGDGDSSSDESLGSVAPRSERPKRPVAV